MKFDLAKALGARLVMLGGEEPLLTRRALNELIQAAAQGDDFDIETFMADSSTPMDWFASAGTAPFLSPRRVAVVRNLLRMKEIEGLRDDLPPTALVILVVDDEPGDESKQKEIDGLTKKWIKAVEKSKGVAFSFAMDAKVVAERLREDAHQEGKELSPTAAETLKEMCGGRYSRAREELEKLVLYVGAEKTISDEQVRLVATASREWNVFKLTDAILRGQRGEALGQLRILVGSRSKAADVAFQSILPQLSRQLRLLWQARLLLDSGGNLMNVPESVKREFPSKPNLLGEKEYPQKLALQAARRVTLNQISRSFRVLSETDARLKGQLSYYNALDTLDRMVLELIAILAPSAKMSA